MSTIKNDRIDAKLKSLPTNSGVYLMKNKDNKIIYVGKAVNLKNRVSQYFHKNQKIKRIEKLVENICDFDYIVTDTEDEALLLENNMIKKYKPKYNVLLKDDKTYSYIKVDMKSDYPTYFIARRVKNDGSKYFGPYPSAGTTNALLTYIKDNYMIRLCKPFKYRKRPCLYYQIKQCDAPCIKGKVSKEEYRKRITEINRLLSGNMNEIIKELTIQMNKASENMDYEKAAKLRDSIKNIKRGGIRQKVNNFNFKTIDAIGMYRNYLETVIIVFEVRGSKLQGVKKYFLGDTNEFEEAEVITMFFKQYYIGQNNIANKIMVKYSFEGIETLEKMFIEEMGYKVEIVVPKIGEKLRFIEMAEENAKIELENKNKNNLEMLLELKEKLNLEKLPRRIEAYDNSNISGSYLVSGMAVITDGKLDKRSYRRFKVEDVIGQDDYLSMKKTIKKRFRHTLSGKKGLGNLPDLIIADGGIGQIRVIEETLKELAIEFEEREREEKSKENKERKKENNKTKDKEDNNRKIVYNEGIIRNYNEILDIKVFGLVKDDKHRTRALITADGKEINVSENTMRQLAHLQEEVHDTAIKYHRKLRDKEITKSALDDIPGIGSVKKKSLLKEFKSVENIKKQDVAALSRVKGITEELAQKIRESLGGN